MGHVIILSKRRDRGKPAGLPGLDTVDFAYFGKPKYGQALP
jgi:hypothetical protein